MEFCDECGSMMKTEGDAWVCGSCGAEKRRDEESALPTTEAHCPNCGNDRARWYMQQIRAADESETRFFICTECDHKWREDDN